MQTFGLIALTPPAVSDPSIAIAACRAGALGALDLEYLTEEEVAIEALTTLARLGRSACGVRLGSGSPVVARAVLQRLPDEVSTLIVPARAYGELKEELQHARARGRMLLLEVLDRDQARSAEGSGVDGLIARGLEAGGWIGDETTFILLQRLVASTQLPVWAHGGIGLHTAPACFAGGAAGVVLDLQFALTRESPLPAPAREAIARMDGSETICLGEELGAPFRAFSRPRLQVLDEVKRIAGALSEDPRPLEGRLGDWRDAIGGRVGWGDSDACLWPIGQDATFARELARRFVTVGGIIEGMRQAIRSHARTAKRLRPLDESGPLAQSHGTRYPIVQGPMTRVSDSAAFAAAVAAGGGLPFLALALLRGPQVRSLLAETKQHLGDRPWGVGILGFVPLELRQEQLDAIRLVQPPFALIAGGRPDQASSLEQAGIPTYLHVPSPGLLRTFLEGGVRRFVFEGRECGGHVGPRSSFVLWNTMIDVLLESLPASEVARCHVLFAGGIHDPLSASMVATMAAPLAERGARIGVLLGTAYLFTQEAVATRAILPGFQQEAIRCARTVLLETGPGHATRCADTPYAKLFVEEKRRLIVEGRSAEDIRSALEELNLGRLRIASKGINRPPRDEQNPQDPKFMVLSEGDQHTQGMYMIGQVAALRNRICTIEELHREVSVKSSERLAGLPDPDRAPASSDREGAPCDVAIIGMACLLPKARDLQVYWENILNKVDAITEVPESRWDWRRYFDEDPKARDKVYSKWGGFIDPIPFDPTRYGMPPATLPSIEPLQLLTLEVVRAALQDAGYVDRPFPRERTSVILGVGGGVGDLGTHYAFRATLPMAFNTVSPDVLSRLPEWTEDSFPGVLMNVAAGRVANRFNLGGVNYTVDAACAASLAAVYLAARELEAGTSDMAIVGGADTFQSAFTYLCFSKTQALSPRGRCRTFDESADGIVISEGIAVLVLKRLADAERDGDRIYAVIKGIAGSSDGRDKGLTAPRPEGQALALERAYAKAGFSPATVGLIEAHGTGTVAGDQAEVATLKRVFEAAGAARQGCAIGSVKSMIGHTKSTAGCAGLIKVALALYHKVLPPTVNVEKPNAKACFPESPLYVNAELRPWVHATAGYPRRAGVSSFGFGGTNFHTVLEEYTGDFLPSAHPAAFQEYPSELLLWTGSSRQEILTAIEALQQALARDAKPKLRDLAYTLWHLAKERPALTLAMVATSLEDLRQKLASARESLRGGQDSIHDPRGIYFVGQPLWHMGKIAFLFPGQGSQYPDMLRELTIQFSEVRERIEFADRVLSKQFSQPLSAYVFPPPRFSPEEEAARQQDLTQTNVAQPALGAADMGLFHLLRALGIKPDMVAGHSYGEYVALCAADIFDEETLYTLSEARGRCIIDAAEGELGTMAAADAGRKRIGEILRSVEGVWIANLNAPRQTILSGTHSGIAEAIRRLEAEGIRSRPVAVACAFHSPLIAAARDRFSEVLSTVRWSEPRLEVFSNTTASPYPRDPGAITALLAEHLVRPVEFENEIEAMYRAGARVFIEVGPRDVLTRLARQILGDRPHLAVASDVSGRPGLLQLQHALGQLAAHGVPQNLDRLFQGRTLQRLNLAALEEETREKPLPPTVWLVDAGRAQPLREAAALHAPAATSAVETSDHGKIQTDDIPTGTNTSAPVGPKAIDGLSRSVESEACGRTPQGRSPKTEPSLSAGDARHPGASTSPPSTDGESHNVMVEFQRLMNRFLETQQQIMLAYLGRAQDDGRLGASGPPFAAAAALPPIPALPAPHDPTEAADHLPSREPISAVPVASQQAAAATGPSISQGPSVPVAQQDAPSPVDRDQLTRMLLQIVSERTGYPPEMLDLDLNIEADLGIDSIKRVEILGAFQRLCDPSDDGKTQVAMEALTRLKTLRGIVDWATNAPQSQSERQVDGAAIEAEAATGRAVDQPSDVAVEVPRFLLSTEDAPPLSDHPDPVPSQGVFLITDDERGIAQATAEELRQRGGCVALVRMGAKLAELGRDVYAVDLANPAGVSELLSIIRSRQGPILGLIHLLPLWAKKTLDEMDLAEWRARLRQEIQSLFCLAKAAAEDLKRAGDGWLVAGTALGGTFASDSPEPRGFFPGQGGIAGLIKSLALEWPGVCCKVVDFDPTEPPSSLAVHLVREMSSRDGRVEVGYRGSRRLLLRPRPAPLEQDRPTRLPIDSSWVVLVTGGARGITAEVACELAIRHRPTLVLVGRSPLPEPEESPETAGLTSPRELKAAMMDCLRRAGEPVTPARVEAAYSRLLQDREMRRNVAAMEQAGATLRYYQVDVRDERAVGNLLDEIYRVYGRLDGVIHGAGVIEDRLIEDKAPDSFSRVLDTKVDSAFILTRKLRPESLKCLIFFSSVAGRFGNRGQSDYAAANEILNKLAIYLDRRWAGRVVSINWGPWGKTGMVSAELQKQFLDRGLHPIPPAAGRNALRLELQYGQKGEVEVVIGRGPWERAQPVQSAARDTAQPLLNGLPLSDATGGGVELIRSFDPGHDLYLQDHQLDGKPVVPVAIAMELMAEVVQHAWPDLCVIGVRDLQVLRGVVLENGSKTVLLVARVRAEPSHERLGGDVQVEIMDPEKPGHPYYRATVELADRLPEPPSFQGPLTDGFHPFPMGVEEAYRQWLFHGPLFQNIVEIHGVSEHGMVATCLPSSPRRCLTGNPEGQWLIDPVVFDSGLQLVILWTRAHLDMTPLPSRFRRYRRFGSLSGANIRCHLQVLAKPQSHLFHINLSFVGPDGRLLGLLEEMECPCSKALNRLADGNL